MHVHQEFNFWRRDDSWTTHAKLCSKRQPLLALSSGENEFYAALKASAEGLGMMSLLKDFNYVVTGEVWGDASAALGIIHRRGRGCMRHIDAGLFWIQQTAAEKSLKCKYGI